VCAPMSLGGVACSLGGVHTPLSARCATINFLWLTSNAGFRVSSWTKYPTQPARDLEKRLSKHEMQPCPSQRRRLPIRPSEAQRKNHSRTGGFYSIENVTVSQIEYGLCNAAHSSAHVLGRFTHLKGTGHLCTYVHNP
jgi:hypothetical protein